MRIVFLFILVVCSETIRTIGKIKGKKKTKENKWEKKDDIITHA